MKTSEPKASETLCARITSLPESRPQPRLRPAPHALRALACATTAHVPSCARARARVGRVLVLVPSRARARAILCSCSCARVLRPVRPVAGCFGGWLLRLLAASVGGEIGFNNEFHTLLIQTFARGGWLGARLSTEVRIRPNGEHPVTPHIFPRLVKFIQLLLPTKVADCTGTGPGRLQRNP